MRGLLEEQLVVYPNRFFAVSKKGRGQNWDHPGHPQNLQGAITPHWTRIVGSALGQLAPSHKYEVADTGRELGQI